MKNLKKLLLGALTVLSIACVASACAGGSSSSSSVESSLEHEHSYVSSVTQQATCTETGVMTYMCDCGDSYTETIDSLGHDKVQVEAKTPTCAEFGWNAYEYCTRCDYSTYQAIPATGNHNFVDGECTECGSIDHDHEWDEGVVTTEPTCLLPGVKTYTCWCTGTITVSVAALGHDKVQHDGQAATCTEIGWDFNPRFHTDERRFAVREFAHLELNCLLYDIEKKIAEIMRLLDAPEKGLLWEQTAVKRKNLMDRYMKNPQDGIYYDYNFKRNIFSKVVSCASFYPYALGISDDAAGAKKVLKKLELDYGLAACEYRGEKEEYLQWDYPSMWPSNVYFAYNALKNVGLTDDATRIAEKYLDTVDRGYLKTGALWEKYDAQTGTVSVMRKYETPKMMGWTAGVYRYLETSYEKSSKKWQKINPVKQFCREC